MRTSEKGPPERAPHRLLSEGRDDKWSVIKLMARHGVEWESWSSQDQKLPYVHDCGGIDDLMKSISGSVKTYHRLGILIDANNEPGNRWEQIKNKITGNGINCPDNLNPDGTIFEGIHPESKIGIWMMPDNSQSGQLEDFLSTLVPNDDPCWSYSQEATNKAKELGACFCDRDNIKARVHTWLAWQEEPGKPFGTAINNAYFNHDSPEAIKFVNWFKRLFLD